MRQNLIDSRSLANLFAGVALMSFGFVISDLTVGNARDAVLNTAFGVGAAIFACSFLPRFSDDTRKKMTIIGCAMGLVAFYKFHAPESMQLSRSH